MTMTPYAHPEYRALFAAVLAAPDDDLPRLVLADWLDENGESARAELIRVQVGISELRVALCTCDAGDGLGGYDPNCPYELWRRLKHRAVEILRAHAGRWLADLPAAFRPALFSPLSDTFRRGFISAVAGPGPDWVAHADAILAAHPVESVTLTSLPETERFSRPWVRPLVSPPRIRFPGRGESIEEPPGDYPLVIVDAAEGWVPRELVLLRKEWPSVRHWHLPDGAWPDLGRFAGEVRLVAPPPVAASRFPARPR